jgi:TonB family protein
VALEQIKTQVLLLHSQQSTLDALSAGFGDRYSVHLATSGSEALTTLGETPIHVIVSAQDLPGMSGLEALREAKKRSPDTIGILLAGEDGDDGLEALVGDEEVFQIVRGAVTPESLLDLVESATQRVRLLAISESANDLAANVDEPAGEHIVMETSENGASIISDGTARLRAIRSQPSRAAAAAGGRQVDVLVLTKDEEFLATIMNSSQELRTVHHANTPAQAESIASKEKVGVLVTDAAMAASDIESITERLRKSVPRLVAIVAGRRDDGELLMDLINRGQVYRFLLKPVSPGRARLAIEASVKHHLEAPDSAFGNKPRPVPAPAKPPARPKHALARRTVGQPPKPAPKSPPTEAAAKAAPAPEASRPPADPGEGAEQPLRASGRFRRTVNGPSDAPGGAAAKPDLSKLKPAYLAGGGAAVLVVVGIIWWLAQGDAPTVPAEREPDAQLAAPEPEPSPSVVESDVPMMDTRRPVDTQGSASVPAYQPFLDEARAAREAGEIVVPPGSNAIELYLAALEIAPENPEIVAELEAVVADALGTAEQALLEQRTDAAAEALAAVRLASPDNLRLPFLEAQLAQLQLRARLDRARAAIREQRFEDAATALAAAEGLVGAEHPEVATLHEELATARSAQRVDEVLRLANERLASDALTVPRNDNARYYFQLALSVDPDNTAARQGLALVTGKLVLRARAAIDNGALDEAGDMLDTARVLDPDSSEVAAVMESLDSARAEATRLEAERLEAERLAEAERPAAGGEARTPAPEQSEATDGAVADTGTGTPSAGTGTGTPSADTGTGMPSAETAGADADLSLAAAAAAASGNAATEPAADPLDVSGGGATDQGGSAEPVYVPVSSLKRTNYVAPRYPRSAQRRNITGWADVSFTVTTQGDVVGVEIMDSSPGDVFSDAATEAIAQWRFEPPVDDGVPVERRVAVRLSFDLE